MSRNDFNMHSRTKSHTKSVFVSPLYSHRNMREESLGRSPRETSLETSSRNTSTPALGLGKHLLRVTRIPIEQMFHKTNHDHSGTLLPEHMYHPPKSSACLTRAPSYSFPKTNIRFTK